MPTRPLPEEARRKVIELLGQGMTHRAISKAVGCSNGSVSNIASQEGIRPADATLKPAVVVDTAKKVGDFDIDEWLDWMETGQALKKKSSYSQTHVAIEVGDGSGPQIICPQGDWHVCSWGTDHSLVRSTIKEINETKNAHFPLMGDLIQMSIKMRSVLEVSDNMMPPSLQAEFLEKLLEKIIDKVPFSTWCNHGVEREEKQSGISMVKHVLSRKTVYFNGIGHPDIKVGNQLYKFAVSHKYRGNSMYDSTFGNKRYARMEANDREVIIQADLHRPAFGWYNEGGIERVALTTGTFQTNSGYAQRYFSLRTCPVMPCVVLYHDEHKIVPFRNLDLALTHIGQ